MAHQIGIKIDARGIMGSNILSTDTMLSVGHQIKSILNS